MDFWLKCMFNSQEFCNYKILGHIMSEHKTPPRSRSGSHVSLSGSPAGSPIRSNRTSTDGSPAQDTNIDAGQTSESDHPITPDTDTPRLQSPAPNLGQNSSTKNMQSETTSTVLNLHEKYSYTPRENPFVFPTESTQGDSSKTINIPKDGDDDITEELATRSVDSSDNPQSTHGVDEMPKLERMDVDQQTVKLSNTPETPSENLPREELKSKEYNTPERKGKLGKCSSRKSSTGPSEEPQLFSSPDIVKSKKAVPNITVIASPDSTSPDLPMTPELPKKSLAGRPKTPRETKGKNAPEKQAKTSKNKSRRSSVDKNQRHITEYYKNDSSSKDDVKIEDEEPSDGNVDEGEEDEDEDDPNKLWCICRKPHNNR